MKVLVKCQVYLIILLATVLFIVGTAASDDQTGPSTGDAMQITKKPTIMILGSGHLANWGADRINYRMDDVLAPKRQAELQALAEQLAQFKPTKIAVEVDERWGAKLQEEYNGYLKGNFQLERHEIHQIGFRLAKDMGHPKVYGVDYFRDDPMVREDREDHLTDYGAFAEANNQMHLLGSPSKIEGKITQDKEGRTWIVPEKYEPIIDMYKIADLLKFMDVQRGFVLQQLIRDQSREDIDLKVYETSMPGVLHLHLCFQFPNHRFNEHPLFQEHLIGHR